MGRGGFADTPTPDRPTVAEVARCLAWLYSDDSRMFKFGTSSYGLKHEVERWARTQDPTVNPYTPNGAMVAALLLSEWPCVRDGPNASIYRDHRLQRTATPARVAPTPKGSVLRAEQGA